MLLHFDGIILKMQIDGMAILVVWLRNK